MSLVVELYNIVCVHECSILILTTNMIYPLYILKMMKSCVHLCTTLAMCIHFVYMYMYIFSFMPSRKYKHLID